MAAQTPSSKTIAVADIQWRLGRFGLAVKELWSDPQTQRRVVLTRFEPGTQLPIHRHVGDEILYVIEGAISDEAGVVGAGNVAYRPAGCVHSGDSLNGATVFGFFTGGLEGAQEIGSAPRTQIFRLHEIAWSDAIPGIKARRIWSDPATGRFAVLSRFEPGAKIPLHRHIGDELIFVLEGSTADEFGEVTAGNLNFRPQGCVHTVSSRNGATVLNIVSGTTEPV